MNRRECTVALLAQSVIVVSLCGPAASDEKVAFTTHIEPIFADHCQHCHNPDRLKGGLDLTTHAAAMKGGSGGAVVVPGDAEGSPLLGVVRHTREPRMPPVGSKLSDEHIELIRRWIAAGCLETPDGAPVKVDRPDVSAMAQPASTAAGSAVPLALPLLPMVAAERAPAAPSLAAHPGAGVVALAGARQVLIYHIDTRRLLGVLPFAEGAPDVVRFSRDGGVLVAGGGTGGKRGVARLWRVADGRPIATVGGEFDSVRAADVDALLRWCALGGPSRVVKVHSLSDGALLGKLEKHTDWVTDVAYSPDAILVASSDRNGGVCLWEAESRQLLHALATHPAAVTSLDWRGDSNLLATACEDGQIRLFEPNGGALVKAWGAHAGGALCVRWSHDGRLVSAGRDRLVKVWDASGAQIRALPEMADIALAAAFDVSGRRIVAADFSGTVRVFNAGDGAVLGELASNPTPPDAQLASAEQQLAAARQSLDAAQAAHDAAQKAAAEAAGRLDAARRQAAQSQAEFARWQAARVRERLDAAMAALEEERSRVALVGREAAAAEQAARAAADALAAARARGQQTDAFIQERTAALTGVRTALDAVRAQHDAAQLALKQRGDARAAMAAAVAQLEAQANAAPAPAALAQALALAREALALVEQEVQQAGAAAQQAVAALSAAQSDVSAAEQRVAEATAELAALPAQIAALESAATSADDQAKKAAQRLAEARVPVAEKEAMMASLQAEYDRLIAEARSAFESSGPDQ